MLRVAVTHLAEFLHRRGDLHARLDGRARAEEGISVQRRLQRDRGEGYQRERAVSLEATLAGHPLQVSGRIDGCDATGPVIVVEEFKTTRAQADQAHAHHASAHWAQAMLYAGLLGRELADGRDFLLRLVYCHPDTLEFRTFDRPLAADQAEAFLAESLTEYERWLADQFQHQDARNVHLHGLDFPYPAFRPFQRAMARRVFQALRDREHLLLEAPTGSGKTAATLFPAVRALEAAGYRRVLFLTSRSTGALAVRDAAARLDPGQRFLRHITITAREKACFVPGTPCEPEACPYARGYYDRSRSAVQALLARRAAGPEQIAEVAEAHRVCPFELSLDAALWCDLAVGDYNYLFDPVVRLQRFSADPDAAILVDESHQLAPRVRDMLSLEFHRHEVRDALAETLPPALASRVRSLDRALTTLKRTAALSTEQIIARPESLLRSMQRFVDELASSELPLDALPATRALLFNASRWLRSDTWYHPDRFVFLGSADGRRIQVRLACLDPGPYIRERLAAYGGHVRFSGTLSPLPMYARLHGEPEAPGERAGNPFQASQLRVLIVDDVPTYLRGRGASLPALVRLIRDVTAARAGHYLVAFPSFEYLAQAADAYAAAATGHDAVQACGPPAGMVRQTPGMAEDDRRAFLQQFAADSPPRIGFVVLGGVFGESVDFSAARLSGVICVGVGLPPPSITRRHLERYFTAQGVDGRAVAYHQPAMVKVLQMAGRLLRDPADRGVLCLVDGRFNDPAYRQFFPSHWQPRTVSAGQVPSELEDFWSNP